MIMIAEVEGEPEGDGEGDVKAIWKEEDFGEGEGGRGRDTRRTENASDEERRE
jgi:hypothetical protein